MRRSPLLKLETRVARLEKKSSNRKEDLLLARKIHKYLAENRLKVIEVKRDLELVDLELFLIGNPKMISILESWKKRGLAVSHSGTTNIRIDNYNSYEEDVDVTYLTRNGANYLHELIQSYRVATLERKPSRVSLKDFSRLEDPNRYLTNTLIHLIPEIQEELRNLKVMDGDTYRLRQISNHINKLYVFMSTQEDYTDLQLNSDLLDLSKFLREKASYISQMTERWDWSPDTPRKANKVVKDLEAILKALK